MPLLMLGSKAWISGKAQFKGDSVIKGQFLLRPFDLQSPVSLFKGDFFWRSQHFYMRHFSRTVASRRAERAKNHIVLGPAEHDGIDDRADLLRV